MDKCEEMPPSSCMGKSLDAVAGMIGIRNETTYEMQAAMELAALARPFASSMKCYPFVIEATDNGIIIRLKDLLAAILQDVRNSCPTEMIAARFHKTIAEISVDVCRRAGKATGLNEVALSGVVWQNQIMLGLVRKELKRDGFTVYTHSRVPANDGGLRWARPWWPVIFLAYGSQALSVGICSCFEG